jgi:pimeloyl-ACP methyl ester carboxylesterase
MPDSATVFSHRPQATDGRGGRHLDIDGARIWVEEAGRRDAPPLVLLHGGLGQLEDFNPVAAALAAEHRLIALDSRGHGASTLGPQRLSYARLQQDVEAVCGALGLADITLVGFSDGGTVALRVALAGRVAVQRVVAIGTTWHPRDIEPNRSRFEQLTAAAWTQKFPDSVAGYQRLNPQPDFERLVQAVLPMWLDGSTDTGHPGEALASLRCPLLLVHGDRDHLVALDVPAALQALLPAAHLLNLPFAGHVVMADEPQLLLAGLRRFLAQTDPPVS